jgi:hypothetical protein
MKFNLSTPLVSFDGKLFTRSTQGEDGTVNQEPLTLQNVLVSACVNADPQEYNDADKKLAIFNLLMKLHGADPTVDLKAEEIATLKKLVGKQLTVVAVGVVCKALDNPCLPQEV